MSKPVNLFGRLMKIAHFFGAMPKEEYREPGAGFIRILYTIHQLWPFLFLVPVILSQIVALHRYWGDTVIVLDIICMMIALGIGIWANTWSLFQCRRFFRALNYLQTQSILTSALVQNNLKLKQILERGKQRCTFYSRIIGYSITLAFLFWIITPFIIRYLQKQERFCTAILANAILTVFYISQQKESNRTLTPRELYQQDGYDQFSFPMWLPLDSTKWYTEIWILQIICYIGSYRAMLPCSTLMICIFSATATQFEIIASLVEMVNDCPEQDDPNALDTMDGNTEMHVNDDETISTRLNAKIFLKEVIKLHQELLKSSEDMGSLQAPAVGITLIFLMLLIITTMFQLTVDPKLTLKYAVTLAAALFHAYIYTFFGEFITEQSENVGKAAYECNWYERSKDFKYLIFMMIIRCQRPCVWTLFSLADVNLITFADFTSICYRFFMVLLEVAETPDTTEDPCLQ